MFGSVRRQSLMSVQQLEIEERFPSKITKHDSLSVYEATLKKLQEGSQRHLIQLQEESPRDISGNLATSFAEEILSTDASCSAHSSLNSVGGFEKEPKTRNISVVCLFSRYKNSQQSLTSPGVEAMLIESDSSSASNSPSSGITS